MSVYINNENKENILKKITQIDVSAKTPTDETERQYYFMAKARKHVQALSEELGRTPTCCVTTFGCQMNVAPVTA
ncbi:MAG: hypothetical protein IKA09_00690 [Lachnospiraceae bacterium]|nr:hypothetical protein [Lachnospiraceae bacterium]